MKPFVITSALFFVLVGMSPGQNEPRVYTQPQPPALDQLNRVDLQIHWHTKIRTRSRRDGLASVQVIPWKENPQILVQTLFGAVLLFDAETGDRLWENQIGEPYQDSQPPGYNLHSIMTTRREVLHVLNRQNGLQRVFTFDQYSKLPHYGYPLLNVPSAAPVVGEYNPKRPDQTRVFLCQENRVTAYTMPDFALVDRVEKRLASADPKAARQASQQEHRLTFDWSYLTADMHFEQAPLWGTNQLAVVSTDGRFLSLANTERLLRYDYQFNKGVVAPMGQHGETAYVGSLDFNLYAFSLQTGRMLWRFASGAPIRRQPAVNDNYVYVTSDREGMNCLFRGGGESTWRNADAERFLAASTRFVYATDRVGQMLVLDQQRGRTLAQLPMRDYNVPVTNELTDRIYFASHDGQILCLRQRDQRRPAEMKNDPLRKFVPEPPPMAPQPMPQPAAAP